MPTVSIDSKSFLLPAGRSAAIRFPIAGASFDPALSDPATWPTVLAQLRHAGFNTVVMRVPWLLHEPTPGRFVFTERCDVRRAVELAGAAGLRVMLRIGPCVGGGFARGGLPGWIHRFAGDRVREADAAFLARVTQFWRSLAPRVADLQATRNGGGVGNGIARPLIAVGIEDDWRCLDQDVGNAYFAALVRFAREVGLDVPLFTANNGWHVQDGLLDAWQGATDVLRTAEELRQVSPEAPPLLLHTGSDVVGQATRSIAARADFVCDVVGGAHVGATSARGCAERPGVDLRPVRRALVFASTFGELIAGLSPDIVASTASAAETRGRTTRLATTLRGAAGEQISVVEGKAGIGFFASGLSISGSRLERCSGSLVALLGEVLVVSGPPRARITVKVDGSEVALAVPSGKAPKVTKVRGLRIAVVADELADGVGIGDDAIEFVDARGALLSRVARDGSVETRKKIEEPAPRARAIALAEPRCLVERSLLDGTHARFAPIAAPASIGDLGVDAMHAYCCAQHAAPRGQREAWIDGRGLARIERAAGRDRRLCRVIEVRSDFLPPTGGHVDERAGVLGPVREVARLRGVKAALVELPRFDATRTGRFIHGYDARPDAGDRRTMRWTFAARSTPVIVRMPDWWRDEGHDRAGHALRLNGAIVAGAGLLGRDSALLDGALLSPSRPKPLAKGEKPPKAKGAQLVAGANELLLDLDPSSDFSDADCRRLAKGVEFLEVLGEIEATWRFARVDAPASWAGAAPVPRKATGVPTWFRWSFTLDAPCAIELEAVHAAGSVASVLVNGASVMVLDGASGAPSGTARARSLARTASIPASMLHAGENQLCVFEPDGVMPAVKLRVPTSRA